MEEFLLIVHILAAAAWIGGGLFTLFSFPVLARQVGVKAVGALDESVGAKFFGSAVVVLLLSGIGLVLTSDAFGWTDAFVLIGLGVIVVDGALQGALLGPRVKRAYEVGDASEFRRVMRFGSVSSVILVVLAVWAMVVKIGT